MIPASIETERLMLRPLRVSDALDMVAVLADTQLYDFTGGVPPTLGELEDRYRRQTAGSGTPGELWWNWIIRSRIGGRAVGFVQATVVGRSADLAWVVGVNDQGQGFAAEAAGATSQWLVANEIDRLEAHIHQQHLASQKVATRIGLAATGTFDEDHEEIWANQLADSHD